MPDPSSILVIQLRRLGDVLVSTPALEALRLAYPRARLDFLVEPPGDQVLDGNPHVDAVLRYDASRPWAMIRDVRARRYDWVIDFLGTPRSALLTRLSGARLRAGPGHVFHRWAYQLRFPPPAPERYAAQVKLDALRAGFGIAAPAAVRPTFPVPAQARTRAEAALAALGVAPGDFVFAVLPFSRRPTRGWPRRHVARLLADFHRGTPARTLLFWGGPREEQDARWIAESAGPAVRLVPDTRDLKFLGALLARADAALACDNGLKHMAMALGVPTLTLHGATRPGNWNPPGDPRFPALRREELFCIGCEKNVCPYRLECLEGLEPGRVLSRLNAFVHGLRETAKRPVRA